jgi:hypothetical protein
MVFPMDLLRPPQRSSSVAIGGNVSVSSVLYEEFHSVQMATTSTVDKVRN